ncbi:MAG: hypothetical protein EBS30_01010 [Planctomycetes bacterium]|jgi:hypothetical protein|nr:hypothetical protein [Planctomycetota bacterium]
MKYFILGLAIALAATFLIFLIETTQNGITCEYEIKRWQNLWEEESVKAELLRNELKSASEDLKAEKSLVELCEQALAEFEKPSPGSTRKCMNEQGGAFDIIEGPNLSVPPETRAAIAAKKAVPEAPMLGAWELVVGPKWIYLDRKIMPSIDFAVREVKPRRWVFVINAPDADMALSQDLVAALDKARGPETKESGVIYITHTREEIPRRLRK